MIWPDGFERVPADDWVRRAPEELARKYDTVREHGWYRNLDPTVETLRGRLRAGDVLLDYSGGTGILAARLLAELGGRDVGILIVDASPKFLRVALEKLGGDERVAYRLIRFLENRRRLETLQEALEPSLLERGVDAVASTNAVHPTTTSTRRCARGVRSSARAAASTSSPGTSACRIFPRAPGSSTRRWRRSAPRRSGSSRRTSAGRRTAGG